MHILFQIIKYFCFQFQSGPGPMAYMMVIDRAVGGMCHVTHWRRQPNSLIKRLQTNLEYLQSIKIFCCCLYYSLSLSLDASLSLSLSHDLDFCDVIKKPGSGCYVIFCLFKAFRPMKLGIRLTSSVCHVTHPSTAWSIIIIYFLSTYLRLVVHD